MTAARTCRWIGCDERPRAHGVCKSHHDKTMRAGRRAIRRAAAGHTPPPPRPRPPVADRLEELEWILGGGCWPPDAARRCGWTLESACAAARKHGRADIAAMLTRHKEMTP